MVTGGHTRNQGGRPHECNKGSSTKTKDTCKQDSSSRGSTCCLKSDAACCSSSRPDANSMRTACRAFPGSPCLVSATCSTLTQHLVCFTKPCKSIDMTTTSLCAQTIQRWQCHSHQHTDAVSLMGRGITHKCTRFILPEGWHMGTHASTHDA